MVSFAAWHWLNGKTCEALTETASSEGRLHALGGEFVDSVATSVYVTRIDYEQVVGAVAAETSCAIRHPAKDGSALPAKGRIQIILVNITSEIRHQQIAHGV